jgi:arsenate reductase
VLKANHVPIAGLRSKSWEEFALSSAPVMDVVITVCDSAASETCPIWPQAPAKVHWGLPDPAAVDGTPDEVYAAFQETFEQLRRRVERLVDIVEPNMDRDLLQARLQDVHQNAA